MEKIITFKLIGPEGNWIIGQDPIELIQSTFGCIEGGSMIDPDEKENLFNDIGEEEFYEYKIVVEKRYTEADLAEMGESDGEIH